MKVSRAIVREYIPRQHRLRFSILLRRANMAGMSPNIIKGAAILFSGMLKWKNYKSVDPDKFCRAAILITYHPSNAAAYKTLTPAAQEFFINLPTYTTQRQWDGYLYLTMLNKLESLPDRSVAITRHRILSDRKTDVVMSHSEAVNAALDEVVRNSTTSDLASRQDVSPPSQEFIALMLERVPPAFNILDFNLADALFMCKIIYTERTVTDFYEKFRNYRRPLTGIEIFSILDDWDNLKTYPAEWIMSVR